MSSPKKARRSVITMAVTLVSVGLIGPAALAANPGQAPPRDDGRQIVSRYNGAKMAVHWDSKNDEDAIVIRAPGWDSYQSIRWSASVSSEATVIKNRNGDQCLQPDGKTAKLHQAVVVRSCDGSSAQKWTYARGRGGGYLIRAADNPDLAVALASPNASEDWTTLRLERAWYTTDRLWNLVE